MINVCIIGPYPKHKSQPFSGPMRVVYSLANKLDHFGDLKIEVPSRPFKSDLKTLSRIITSKAEIFHIHGVGNLQFLASIIAVFRRKKIIYSAHGLATREAPMGYRFTLMDKMSEVLLFRKALAVVSVSDMLKAMIVDDFRVNENKVFVIGNGVDRFFLESESNPSGFRAKYGILETDSVILFAAGMGPATGVPFLFDGLSGLGEEAPFKLLIAGGMNNFEVLSKYERHGLIPGKNVVLSGRLCDSELRDAYHSCRFVIHPCSYETFGLIPLEAMASGKAVIITDKVGMSCIVKHGHDAYIIEYGDKNQLRDAVLYFLNNPDACSTMGRNARNTAKQYDWDKVALQYAEVYRAL